MNIVLDTNIYFSDFLLGSKKMQLVTDYLKKTNSRIILPQLVYEELTAVYERELMERVKIFKDADGHLNRMLIKVQQAKLTIDPKNETQEYLEFLKSKLNIKDKDIFPYKDAYLKNITDRAINRIKPCTDKGEEFRDSLLWLSLLDIAKDKKEIIFISSNTRQFASHEKILHPDLIKEADAVGVKINYYCSLDAFIQDHAIKIDFITEDWIRANLNLKIIDEEIIKALELHGERSIMRWAEQEERRDTTGYYNVLSPFVCFESFYVYEKNDGSYYVEAVYAGEVEIEIEFGAGYDYRHEVDIESEEKCLMPQVTATFGIDIKDKKITAFELTDWEIY